MARLAELQRAFLASIADEAALSGMRLRGDDARERIALYRGNLRANLRGALAATYPVTERLVGEAFFSHAADAFMREHPSASGDLHDFGRAFPAFLGRHEPACALEYLPDVARLEWACHEALHAADAGAFDFAALSARAPAEREAIRFHLHPTARCVHSPHAILAIHEANQPGCDGTPRRLDGPDRVLVWRAAGTLRFELLSASERDTLEAIARGVPLGELLEPPRDAARLTDALRRWVEARVIAGFGTRS